MFGLNLNKENVLKFIDTHTTVIIKSHIYASASIVSLETKYKHFSCKTNIYKWFL